MPRPEELPGYVEWLEADIAALGGVGDVADSSIDLVYSGQNVEHLWPEQMLAFFTETNRILHDGGWLVVDSPNREVTAELSWSMAEHTIEFAPDEVGRLFELAGFELTTLKGVWLCRSTANSCRSVLSRTLAVPGPCSGAWSSRTGAPRTRSSGGPRGVVAPIQMSRGCAPPSMTCSTHTGRKG